MNNYPALSVLPEVTPPTDLLTCDAEPIHIPGAIQDFGFLVAMDQDGRIFRISANLNDFLPLTPNQALGQPIEALLGKEIGWRCRTFVNAMAAPLDDTLLPVFDAHLPGGRQPFTLSLTVNTHGLIIECEPSFHEEIGASVQALHYIADSIGRLRQAGTSQELLETAARILANRGCYHRTLVYRFDNEMNGEVIVEVVNGVAPRWLGHHFPSADIPAQARALYLRNQIRMIVDVAYTPIPLLGFSNELTAPLDLSDAMLRSVSPIHLEYLRNMDVCATLTMSLIIEDRLWGMIVCHHQEPRQAPRALRLFCNQIAQFVSLELQNRLAAEQRQAAELLVEEANGIMELLQITDSIGTALTRSPQILLAWDADAFALVLYGERTLIGRPVPEGMLEAIDASRRSLGTHGGGPQVYATERLAPQLNRQPVTLGWVAGALLIPINPSGEDYLLWLRREQIQQVKWAGQPDKPDDAPPEGKSARLSPRGSFATWIEVVSGRSLAWTRAQTQAAQYLAQVIRNQLANELKLSREREELTRRIALYDALTGLPNRILLMDRLQRAIIRAQRYRRAFAVCFIDLDQFKPVNDQFGHAEGDEVLKGVAARLNAQMRHNDTLARVGGDEFVALIEDIEGANTEEVHATTVKVVSKLIHTLDCPLALGQHQHSLGMSMGIACYPELIGDPHALLHAADLAMYVAKKSGKNPVFADTISL